jgi:hypothetical protein
VNNNIPAAAKRKAILIPKLPACVIYRIFNFFIGEFNMLPFINCPLKYSLHCTSFDNDFMLQAGNGAFVSQISDNCHLSAC